MGFDRVAGSVAGRSASPTENPGGDGWRPDFGRPLAVGSADLDRLLQQLHHAGLMLAGADGPAVEAAQAALDSAVRILHSMALSALAPTREPGDLLVRLEYLAWDVGRLEVADRTALWEALGHLDRARLVLQEALFGIGVAPRRHPAPPRGAPARGS